MDSCDILLKSEAIKERMPSKAFKQSSLPELKCKLDEIELVMRDINAENKQVWMVEESELENFTPTKSQILVPVKDLSNAFTVSDAERQFIGQCNFVQLKANEKCVPSFMLLCL